MGSPQPPPVTGPHAAAPAPSAPERAPAASTPAGQAAAGFALALSKAARAFTLYDPANAVVRQFLADYRQRAADATAGGPLVVEVQPFELIREGEAIYREEDREKSLAFRLFRDGVRRLTFEPEIPWEELLAFLEMMAVRYTGVRQQEEDLATQLRKAEFRGLHFQAVEGFQPEEQDPEPEEARRQRGQGAQPPAGFDTPFPLLPPPGPVTWRAVPPEALEPLVAEEGPEGLARNALRLAGVLLSEAARGTVQPREAELFLAEVRDYLVADGALAALAALADLVGRLPAGPLRDGVLRTLGDARLLTAIMAAVPAGSTELPAEAARLLPLLPGHAALDLLTGEADPARRTLLLRLAESRLPADAAAVVTRLPSLDAEAALALFQAVSARAPASAAGAAAALLEHPDEAVQVAALRALAAHEGDVPLDRLLRLMQAPREPVRLAALEVLSHRPTPVAFRAVLDALQQRKDCSRDEAAALGRALARIGPTQASPLLAEWLKPRRGLLGRLAGGKQDDLLRWAAVAALGAHPAADATAQLEAVAKDADEALRRHCFATLARRRHEGGRHG